MKKAWLSGATGLVGIHLAKALLQRGYALHAIKRAETDTAHVQKIFEVYACAELFEKIVWHNANLNDIESLIDSMQVCEVAYHAAAMVSFNGSNARQLQRTNIQGTANVVNACLASGVPTLAYVSSTAALGRNPKTKVVNENIPWTEDKHTSSYAISKHYAEREVWRGGEEGLNITMVNPCVIIGPGKWGQSSTSLMQQADAGLKFYTSGSNAFVDVRDVAEVLIQLTEKQVFNERFLLIGENLSFKTLFDTLAEALNKPKPSIATPRFLAEVAWRLLKTGSLITGKEAKITRETVASAYRTTHYKSDKLKSFLPEYKTYSVKEAAENAARFYVLQ